MNYVQCSLRRNSSVQVSWIPEKFAIQGKVLRLKEHGMWEDGWEVASVGTKLHEDMLPDSHKSIKEHWKNTSGPAPIGHK